MFSTPDFRTRIQLLKLLDATSTDSHCFALDIFNSLSVQRLDAWLSVKKKRCEKELAE